MKNILKVVQFQYKKLIETIKCDISKIMKVTIFSSLIPITIGVLEIIIIQLPFITKGIRLLILTVAVGVVALFNHFLWKIHEETYFGNMCRSSMYVFIAIFIYFSCKTIFFVLY